jgi:hypothetical protein
MARGSCETARQKWWIKPLQKPHIHTLWNWWRCNSSTSFIGIIFLYSCSHLSLWKPCEYSKSKLESLFATKQIDFNYFSSGLKVKSYVCIPFYRNRAKAHLGLSSKVRGCNISFWRDDFAKSTVTMKNLLDGSRDIIIKNGYAGMVEASQAWLSSITFIIRNGINHLCNAIGKLKSRLKF